MESTNKFEISRHIRRLEKQIGCLKFGYFVQKLLAETLHRLSFRVEKYNAQGHPDIELEHYGKKVKIEVEVVGPNRFFHTIKTEDLEATRAKSEFEEGYLVIFTLHLPCSFLLIKNSNLPEQGPVDFSLAELGIIADKGLSRDCTREMFNFIEENVQSIKEENFFELTNAISFRNN